MSRRRQPTSKSSRIAAVPVSPVVHPAVRTTGSLVLLVCATVIVYLNSFSGDFQFDDYNVIVFNPSVHSLVAWAQGMPGIRPLLKLSYTLNWVASQAAFGFHLVNLALHITNSALVFLLLSRLGGSNLSNERFRIALLAALLFSIHPVQTEAVTYICGRSVSLMALFYLASLWAYELSRESQSAWFYAVSPSLFVLALLTRETAVTLPLALLLWEAARTQSQGRPHWRSCMRRQAMHWVLLALGLLAMLYHPTYRDLLAVSLNQRDTYHNVLTQINGISYLLTRLVWVQQLNIDPDLAVIISWNSALALEALLLLTLLVLSLKQWRQRPWLAFGVLWFFLHLMPTNSILPRLDVTNERHLYLANLGVFYLVATACFAAWSKVSKIQALVLGSAGVIMMLVLAVFTIQRNSAYEYQLSLWLDTVQNSPNKARPHNNLGFAYALEGEPDKARQHYLTALRLQPDYALARNNLAHLPTSQSSRISP